MSSAADEVRTARVGEHAIAYRDRASGPPVVFLHGWPVDGREFVRQLDDLSDSYRVLAWDAPGAGASTDPPEGASLDDWADRLAGFLQSLDVESAHVAGLSWGGGLALAFVHRYPSWPRASHSPRSPKPTSCPR